MSAALPALYLTRERPGDIARLDRDGALQRVRAGVYVRRSEWAALMPWERYRLRVHAVARTWSAPVFCLESAASELGLPLLGEARNIHLLSPDGRSWREGDVIVHGWTDERALHAGALMTTGLADTTLDLCRVLPPAFALAVADAALRLLPAGGPSFELSVRGRAQANRRGVRQLDWVEARASAQAESPGESVSRAAIEWLGFEKPELQQVFTYEGETDRSDFYWRRLRIVGESDGYGKYNASDSMAMKDHFVREKRREDRLRRHEGGFVRWDWADVVQVEPLDRKLRAAGLTPISPRQSLLLASLASNPRAFAHRTKGFPASRGA